jgi:hypothetical protein
LRARSCARTLSSVVKAIGLGFVDRLLGAVFGVARGLALVVLFALVAGLTTRAEAGLVAKCDAWTVFGGSGLGLEALFAAAVGGTT